MLRGSFRSKNAVQIKVQMRGPFPCGYRRLELFSEFPNAPQGCAQRSNFSLPPKSLAEYAVLSRNERWLNRIPSHRRVDQQALCAPAEDQDSQTGCVRTGDVLRREALSKRGHRPNSLRICHFSDPAEASVHSAEGIDPDPLCFPRRSLVSSDFPDRSKPTQDRIRLPRARAFC